MPSLSLHYLLAISTLPIGSFGLNHQRPLLHPNLDPVLTHTSTISPNEWVDLREIAEPASQRPRIHYKVSTSGESELLHFDDIKQDEPLGNISTYQNAYFEGFRLLNVSSAWQHGRLANEDLNCAVSAPNAILGRRVPDSRAVWPRFYLSHSSDSEADSHFSGSGGSGGGKIPFENAPSREDLDFNPPLFNLISVTVKPVGYVPVNTAMHFILWNITHGKAETVRSGFLVYGGEGYQDVFRLEFGKWSNGNWAKGFNVFEIYGRGWKGEDVPFCLDDLEVLRV